MASSLSRPHATAVFDAPSYDHLPTATTVDQAGALILPGPFRRAAVVVGDVLGAVAIVLCLPLVILAIGMPIALCVRLLLWIGGLL